MTGLTFCRALSSNRGVTRARRLARGRVTPLAVGPGLQANTPTIAPQWSAPESRYIQGYVEGLVLGLYFRGRSSRRLIRHAVRVRAVH